MKKSRIVVLFAFVSIALAFSRPDTQLEQLFARLDSFNQAAPQEKVHLQLDKPYYSLGDPNGQASLSFFNADGTGTYRVTIEGMDTKGKC